VTTSRRVSEARARAHGRRDARARLLSPIGWSIVALAWASNALGDPPPSLHGDGLAVLLGLVLATAAMTDLVRPDRAPARTVVAALLLAGAGIVVAASHSGGTGELLGSVAVFVVAYRLPREHGAIAAGALTAATATGALAVGADDAGGVAATAVLCVLLAFVALTLRRANASQDHAEELLAELEDARDAATVAAAAAERARIAGELHDVLAHSLSGAAIQLQGARRVLERADADPVAAAAVGRAAELVREGLAEARDAVGALRGGHLPTIDRLDELVGRMRTDLALDVAIRVEGTPRALAPEPSVALYRGVQEALTNAARHAPGARVEVTVRYGARRARARRPHAPRGRGPAAHRRGLVQRRDPRAPRHQRRDGQDPRQPDLRQVRRPRPRPGRQVRLRARPGLGDRVGLAAQAGAQPVAPRAGGVAHEEHVLAQRLAGARRAAVDAAGAHADQELAVGARVPALVELPAAVVVEVQRAAGHAGLVGEEPALGLDAAGVAGERARRADHAVAGHDDRDRVAGVRGPDGAGGATAQREVRRDVAVGGRRAVGHLAQRRPDALLQRAAGRREREVEGRPRPREVLLQLRGGVGQDAAGVRAPRAGRGPALVVGEVEAAQAVGVVGDEQQRAQRAGDGGVAEDVHARRTRARRRA
jgi:signal transduction histidine kinase